MSYGTDHPKCHLNQIVAAREPKLASASNPQAQIPAQVAWQCCHVMSMLHTGELPGHGGLAALPCCCWPLVLFQAANLTCLQTVLLQQGLSTALKIGMAAPEGPREGAVGDRGLECSWRRQHHELKVSCGKAASSTHPVASAWGELRAQTHLFGEWVLKVPSCSRRAAEAGMGWALGFCPPAI